MCTQVLTRGLPEQAAVRLHDLVYTSASVLQTERRYLYIAVSLEEEVVCFSFAGRRQGDDAKQRNLRREEGLVKQQDNNQMPDSKRNQTGLKVTY